MKTQAHRIEELQHGRLEADLGIRIAGLFRRCPTLCGFSVRDAADDQLRITEVSVYPASFRDAPLELCDEIVASLLELIREAPDARELLRGRTFARVFH